MAQCRDVFLVAALIGGVFATPGWAAPHPAIPVAAPAAVQVQYYQPERPYYRPPHRRRQVCWTEYRRIRVGYTRHGRPVYRQAPRRVCGYR